MSLLVTAKPATEPSPAVEPKLRNRLGIKGIFDRNMDRREKVTLEQAIEILRANW